MSKQLLGCIQELRADRKAAEYTEDQTKLAIVLKILDLLGWSCFDADEVCPEYSVGQGRVDYALRINGHNKVFIEVKKRTEDLEKHQPQILDYSFKEGVGLAILTNGISWWFYLPLSEGSWEERRKFYAIDINQQDPAEVTRRFTDFLGRHSVETGRAIEAAQAIYRSQQRDHSIRETIPKAWRAVISEPDELLVDLIIDRTEELCGYKPEKHLVEEFLRTRAPLENTAPTPIRARPRQTRKKPSKKPSSFHFQGKEYPVRHWNEVLTTLCAILYTRHRKDFEKLLSISGTKRPLFSRDGKGMANPKKIEGAGIYVECNWSSQGIVAKCRQILRALGYSDHDFTVRTG